MGIRIKYERGCFSGEIFFDEMPDDCEEIGADLKNKIDTLNRKSISGMSSRAKKDDEPETREVGSLDEFMAWYAAQEDKHSINGLKNRGPFANSDKLARDAL